MTLVVRDLVKSYAGFQFGPVSLSVGREVLAVLGPSGSGKSTLLSAIAGIVTPDGGSIVLDGRQLVGLPLEDRGVGLVFQEGALFPHMTARENVAYAAVDDDRVADLASVLELGDVLDRRPSELSGGERQRVALARTLAADPDALLLDEPLSSLDAPIRRRLRSELRDLFDALEIPVVSVTHDQRTATALGDRIAIVRDGGVEQVGPPSAVVERPATRFVASFTGNENCFEASVASGPGSEMRLRIGNLFLLIAADVDEYPAGSTVTACIHPSRVALHAPGETVEAPSENVLAGTVHDWLNEGTEYRVAVRIGHAPLEVTATVRPPTFDHLAVETGSPVRVSVPPGSIHLIE